MNAEAVAKMTVNGRQARLTLDRPRKCNAVNFQMAQEMSAALRELPERGVLVAVLDARGAYFCGGVDLADIERRPGEIHEAVLGVLQDYLTSPILWIAGVSGPALGMGMGLAAVCPIVVASEDSWFCMPEMRLGVFPKELLKYVSPVLGERRALEMALSARRLPAREAHALGLVAEIVPRDEVQTRCEEMMANLAANAHIAEGAQVAWRERAAEILRRATRLD